MERAAISDAISANYARAGTCVFHLDAGYSWGLMRALAQELEQIRLVAGRGRARAVLVARNAPAHVGVLLAQFAQMAPTQMIYSAQTNAGIVADVAAAGAPIVIADEADWSDALIDHAARAGAVAIALGNTLHAPLRRLDRWPLSGEDPAPLAEDVALELLSSGTSGPPKRLPLSWDALDAVLADARAVYEDPGANGPEPAPAIVVHPLGNVSGLNYVAGPLAAGQPIVLLERFRVEDWVAAVERHRPRRGALPPAAIRMVYDADVPPARLCSLVAIGTGGGPLDNDLKQAFERRHGVAILPAYGATEFGGVVANWSLDLHREYGASKLGSCGRARPGVAFRVIDPGTGMAVPDGTIGDLEVRVERIGEAWIRTTDRAAIDGDGFLFLHGRSDGAIIRGGFKVLPDMVADVLRTHPAVADAAVVGIDDARLGQVPVAALELREPGAASTEEIAAFARDRLLAYQIPVQIRIVQALPRNASMKVATGEVRSLFGQSADFRQAGA